MSELSQEDYCALLRLDLGSFAERCFRHLNPGVDFIPGWHVDLTALWFELCKEEGARLVINMPPRHLKSLIGSVALPAWLLGHKPSMKIICASYGAELSEQFSRECRSIMDSPWYKRVFPKTRLARQTNSELTTTAHGSRIATSVDGVLTGRGADVIIIDDPIKPSDALSETVRKNVNGWFDNTLFSRLNDKKKGSIAVIMQRLHEDDLTGHLLSKGDWQHLALPAISEEDETCVIEHLGEKRVFGRKNIGEALHPEREPIEVLQKIRETIGAFNFAGQYQQSPAPLTGGFVERSWFKTYTDTESPGKFDMVLQSWDTANKPGELSDYSVCTTWGMLGSRLYLLHVLRKKLGFPDLKRAVREQAKLHRPDTVLIEDKASGTQLIQELVAEGMRCVKAYKPPPGMDKQMRMHAQTCVIENGFVYLPKTAEWLDAYVHELTTFPASRYDDQVDSTSQALHWFATGRPRDPAILTYYEALVAKMRGASAA